MSDDTFPDFDTWLQRQFPHAPSGNITYFADLSMDAYRQRYASEKAMYGTFLVLYDSFATADNAMRFMIDAFWRGKGGDDER